MLQKNCVKQFQFQNGAIKRRIVVKTEQLQICFNSKMVRLKALAANSEYVTEVGFNSKMVRLKAKLHDSTGRATTKFQFQNGAIKRVSVVTQM